LLNVTLAPNVGLTGNGLSGTMTPSGDNDWLASGIPITPLTDAGVEDPYQLATIAVDRAGTKIAQTRAVVPVSWEINCNLCHNTDGISTDTDILRAHDRLHGTTLENEKPVLCARCHADNALGAAGTAGVSNLSGAMHGAHAARMSVLTLDNECYACHPGAQTKCLRDVHFAGGMTCKDCHTSMAAVADPARQPWIDEPRCDGCHTRAGFQFEQANTRYRDSKGHGNVHCAACHGAPHAVAPTVTDPDKRPGDNSAGTRRRHQHVHRLPRERPRRAFFHRLGGDD